MLLKGRVEAAVGNPRAAGGKVDRQALSNPPECVEAALGEAAATCKRPTIPPGCIMAPLWVGSPDCGDG
jgi:hypothetical protein